MMHNRWILAVGLVVSMIVLTAFGCQETRMKMREAIGSYGAGEYVIMKDGKPIARFQCEKDLEVVGGVRCRSL